MRRYLLNISKYLSNSIPGKKEKTNYKHNSIDSKIQEVQNQDDTEDDFVVINSRERFTHDHKRNKTNPQTQEVENQDDIEDDFVVIDADKNSEEEFTSIERCEIDNIANLAKEELREIQSRPELILETQRKKLEDERKKMTRAYASAVSKVYHDEVIKRGDMKAYYDKISNDRSLKKLREKKTLAEVKLHNFEMKYPPASPQELGVFERYANILNQLTYPNSGSKDFRSNEQRLRLERDVNILKQPVHSNSDLKNRYANRF